MKIDASPDLLVIEYRPVWIAVMLGMMVLIFAGMGIGVLLELGPREALMPLGAALFLLPFIAVFVRRNQLILDRRAGELIHRRKSVFGYSETRHPLRDLREAVVETSTSNGGSTRRMAYVLEGDGATGPHPFTTVYSSGSGARRAADAVNAWLARAPGETQRGA